jgi:pimeloyl-ACP methyl ester carboxylesterase
MQFRSRQVAALLGITIGAAAVARGGFSAFTPSGNAAPEELSSQASSSAEATPQVTGVAAVHREGQTFVTWQEVTPPPPVKTTMKELEDLTKNLNETRRISYRVYRASQPITRVSDAVLVGERGPLSGWNAGHYGRGGQSDPAVRFVIRDGGEPLSSGTGLFVHQSAAPGPAYYAVTAVVAGKEAPVVTNVNRAGPVEETVAAGTPVFQRTESARGFNHVEGPITLQFYVRWEPPGNASRPGQPFDYLVAIPPGVKYPAPVGLHMHEWGGSMYGLYGWWFNAEKGSVLVASNQEPYDWWTGYHEQYYGPRPAGNQPWKGGVVRPYTQTRLLSFVDWLSTRMSFDRSRMFAGGSSMGGSGALMMAIRHPERIAWAIGWVGVHVPRDSPQFRSSYELVWGPPEWNVKFEDGTPVWDYFDDAQYVLRHRAEDMGFITFSNGKNDGAIGWSQAVKLVRALQEARQPHLFTWGQGGHNERARMPDSGGERVNPLDLKIDQSLPAFTKGSLDNALGDGEPSTGDPGGQINQALAWSPESIRDEKDRWTIVLRLTEGAPVSVATADVTPRRLQQFKVRTGERVQWTNEIGGRVVQSGDVDVDQWGLILLPQVQIAKNGSRVTVRRGTLGTSR